MIMPQHLQNVHEHWLCRDKELSRRFGYVESNDPVTLNHRFGYVESNDPDVFGLRQGNDSLSAATIKAVICFMQDPERALQTRENNRGSNPDRLCRLKNIHFLFSFFTLIHRDGFPGPRMRHNLTIDAKKGHSPQENMILPQEMTSKKYPAPRPT